MSAQKHSSPLKEKPFYWVASAAASASLRVLPRYLPWLQRDASHPSAPDATRVARLNQRFPKHYSRKLRSGVVECIAPQVHREGIRLIIRSLAPEARGRSRVEWRQRRIHSEM